MSLEVVFEFVKVQINEIRVGTLLTSVICICKSCPHNAYYGFTTSLLLPEQHSSVSCCSVLVSPLQGQPPEVPAEPVPAAGEPADHSLHLHAHDIPLPLFQKVRIVELLGGAGLHWLHSLGRFAVG